MGVILALVVVVCVVAGLPSKQIVHRFRTSYRELVSSLRGCGSWLWVVETAAKLVLD